MRDSNWLYVRSPSSSNLISLCANTNGHTTFCTFVFPRHAALIFCYAWLWAICLPGNVSIHPLSFLFHIYICTIRPYITFHLLFCPLQACYEDVHDMIVNYTHIGLSVICAIIFIEVSWLQHTYTLHTKQPPNHAAATCITNCIVDGNLFTAGTQHILSNYGSSWLAQTLQLPSRLRCVMWKTH